MDVPDARRRRALEDENSKLKMLVADNVLDNAGLKELLSKMVGPAPNARPSDTVCSLNCGQPRRYRDDPAAQIAR